MKALSTTASAVLATLPQALQSAIRQHTYADDLDDLIAEAALQYVCAPDAGPDVLFARARARVRRYTQDPAHYGTVYEPPADDTDEAAEEAQPTPLKRADYVREIARERGVTIRRAQQLVRQALERARECGDLFAGAGEEVAV